jgi:DNA primase large subunit
VFCKSEERRWFIAQEAALLRFRLQDEDMTAFLKQERLEYPLVSSEELAEVEEEVREVAAAVLEEADAEAVAAAATTTTTLAGQYYRVAWEAAHDLVERRAVVVRGGVALVHRSQMTQIVLGQFRAHLAAELDRAAKALPALQADDERLRELLQALQAAPLGDSEYTRRAGGRVSSAELDTLARTGAMPLCMRHLHLRLREHHHLKFQGRLQYGLFLKGIGLTLEDALDFWRQEFTRVMDAKRFESAYAYSIRHYYGREGKRVDYTPYSCAKIILGTPPAAGEYHGCPFRHHEPAQLQQQLQALHLSEPQQAEVLEKARNQHYQIACKRVWEFTHPNAGQLAQELVVNHPNQYFDASFKYLNQDKEKDKDKKPDEPAPALARTPSKASKAPPQASSASSPKLPSSKPAPARPPLRL